MFAMKYLKQSPIMFALYSNGVNIKVPGQLWGIVYL